MATIGQGACPRLRSGEPVVVIHDLRTSSTLAHSTLHHIEKIPGHGNNVVVRLKLDTGYRVDIYLSPPELLELADLVLQELH